MPDLGTEIKNTIRNLEAIRDKQNPPDQDIVHQLNTLYDQALELVAAAIKGNDQKYNDAATKMQAAAQASQNAINNLSQVSNVVNTAAKAIQAVASLLAAV